LQARNIPFILLTNGGGKIDSDRVAELTSRLDVPISTSQFIQSHTPFADVHKYKDKTILVVGGEGDNCRRVAESYGFTSVVTPGDLLVHNEDIWPFSKPFLPYYQRFARPLPKPVCVDDPEKSLKIDAIFVYNDPRDWGLDATVVLDLLLSRHGILGTLSAKNGDASLANKGYQQDGQPPLYFSNPDVWWPARYKLPRLGQGAFREMLEGIWAATTGGKSNGVELQKIHIGKPHQLTYTYAEKKLLQFQKSSNPGLEAKPLRRVYMVGDNPGKFVRIFVVIVAYKCQNRIFAEEIITRAPMVSNGPQC
jgi:HAD superfamily hydrolase (TIGR01456 family)